jgi:hypothetical protein
MSRDRERILTNHKTVVLELVEDIKDNIVKGSIERTVCSGVYKKLCVLPELEMMKISVEVLLCRETQIRERTDLFLEQILNVIFERICGTALTIPFSAAQIPTEDKNCIWRFIVAILGWVREYKKNT